MIGPHVRLDLRDQLVVGVGADDLAALAVDDLANRSSLPSVADHTVVFEDEPYERRRRRRRRSGCLQDGFVDASGLARLTRREQRRAALHGRIERLSQLARADAAE